MESVDNYIEAEFFGDEEALLENEDLSFGAANIIYSSQGEPITEIPDVWVTMRLV